MKPIYQKLTTELDEGFAFKTIEGPGFDCPFHAHSEYELILVLRGNGYRMVGDNISQLVPGDLVLVGPGLPHIWQEDPPSKGRTTIKALLIQFEEKLFGEELLNLTAYQPVRELFRRARRGLRVAGRTRVQASGLMLEMSKLKGFDRLAQLLRILAVLAHSRSCHFLASVSFEAEAQLYDQDRMDRVIQFLNRQIGQTVRLSEAARLISMSEGSFSRFFHAHTGKTFPNFVNELRIGRACRLLTETDKTITEVAYECGFESLTNFNRQFRRIKGFPPRDFRKQIQQHLPTARPSPGSPAGFPRIDEPVG